MKKVAGTSSSSSRSRIRGTPTLGPYSRTDSRPGRLADSGSTLIAPDTPSMSKVSTTAHRVSPGQIPLTRHLPLASRPYTAVIPTAYPVIPAKAGIQGWRGWVPVSTGTTGGSASLPSFLPNQYFAFPSFPRRKTPAQPSFPRTTVIPAKAGTRGGGDGFPSPRERRAAARTYRHSHQPRTSHIRHSRAGRPCVSVIPAQAGTRGGGDGFPSPRERRAAARTYRHSHQPRTSHIRHSRAGRPLHNRHSRESGNQGRRGWVPVSTGTTGGRASLPSFLPNQNSAFPSFPRRKTPAQPSFPRKREPGAAGMGPRLHGDDGRHPVSATIPPPRREHTAHAPPHPCRGPCTTVIPAAFPSFPRRKTPAQPSFPRRRESRGGGDGFPSPRERRVAPRLRRESTSQTRVYRIDVYENWKA